MRLHSVFCGAFIVIILLKTMKADIPGCHFLHTVNISSQHKIQNGSYVFQGHVLPSNLIGEYNYTTTELGYHAKTEPHLRGCVCHLKPCIWICCRFKDMEPNGECNDGLTQELAKINPFLNVTLSNGTVVKRNLLKDFIVLRHLLRIKEGWREGKYTLFENGSVLLRSEMEQALMFRGHDCLHPNQFSSGNTDFWVVSFQRDFFNMWKQSAGALIFISEVFLILTMAVYLYVKKLRNLHGKCFICYLFASFILSIHLWFGYVEIPFQLCVAYGHSAYFFWTAKLTWLLSLSHQMWRGFTSLKRSESQHSFRAYSIFAWGLAALLTGILFLIDFIWAANPSMVNRIPGIGWQICGMKDGWSGIVYINVPFLLLIAINTALFIWTIISIIRTKLSLKHFKDSGDTARNFNSRMQAYTIYIRLFIAMDIQWSLRLISYLANWYYLLEIYKYLNYCIGMIIFVLFILKRSTIQLLMER
ncbi:hypothetical protein KR032_005655 [Drosophila birchii]|nr:hypothetical protein KR032_005655 [Drosophila birchii]